MLKSVYRFTVVGYHALVAFFHVTNMSLNSIRKIKLSQYLLLNLQYFNRFSHLI